MYTQPYILNFKAIGFPEIGYLSVAELNEQLPFEVKRIFWTYDTPQFVMRGRHAHKKTELLLLAVAGHITVQIEYAHTDEIQTFQLSSPHLALYIPPQTWHTMQYSEGAVQLVLASSFYHEDDYVRNYEDFKNFFTTS
jgi:dTDP-4-dehydrorhamnose 3,5-epimerase-like enzyme